MTAHMIDEAIGDGRVIIDADTDTGRPRSATALWIGSLELRWWAIVVIFSPFRPCRASCCAAFCIFVCIELIHEHLKPQSPHHINPQTGTIIFGGRGDSTRTVKICCTLLHLSMLAIISTEIHSGISPNVRSTVMWLLRVLFLLLLCCRHRTSRHIVVIVSSSISILFINKPSKECLRTMSFVLVAPLSWEARAIMLLPKAMLLMPAKRAW